MNIYTYTHMHTTHIKTHAHTHIYMHTHAHIRTYTQSDRILNVTINFRFACRDYFNFDHCLFYRI